MQLERYNGHIEDADFLSMLMVDIAGNIRSERGHRLRRFELRLCEGYEFRHGGRSGYGYGFL